MTRLDRLRWGLGVLVAVGLVAMASAARGQSLLAPGDVQVVVPSSTPRTFGTATSIAYVIQASEFDPISPASVYGYVGAGEQKFSPGSNMVAGLRLPAGALIQSIELEGCDNSAALNFIFALYRAASPGATATQVTPGVISSGTPGCGFFSAAPLPVHSPLIVDNENNTYFIQVGAPNNMAAVAAMRVYYTLQVSPAPAVATFSDVPTTHPFFRFVQALVAAGITSGCGGGRFCVDDPITRGQMAVFLSLALGLHFAP